MFFDVLFSKVLDFTRKPTVDQVKMGLGDSLMQILPGPMVDAIVDGIVKDQALTEDEMYKKLTYWLPKDEAKQIAGEVARRMSPFAPTPAPAPAPAPAPQVNGIKDLPEDTQKNLGEIAGTGFGFGGGIGVPWMDALNKGWKPPERVMPEPEPEPEPERSGFFAKLAEGVTRYGNPVISKAPESMTPEQKAEAIKKFASTIFHGF